MVSSEYEEIPASITIDEPITMGQVKLSLNIKTPIMPAKTRWK